MSINPVSPTTHANVSSASSTSSTTSSGTDYQAMFMQLLATELKSQDPTQTMDPTTMVTQMVQINQLSDVAGIYSILQGGSSTASGAAASAARTTSNAAGAPAKGQPASSIHGGN